MMRLAHERFRCGMEACRTETSPVVLPHIALQPAVMHVGTARIVRMVLDGCAGGHTAVASSHKAVRRRLTAALAGKSSGPPADSDGQQRPRRPPPNAPQPTLRKQQQQRQQQQQQQRPQPQATRAPQPTAFATVDEWLDMARHASASPKVLCDVLRALAGVQQLGGVQGMGDTQEAGAEQYAPDKQQPDSMPYAADIERVRDAVLALVRKRGTGGRQLATFADALGTGLEAQPAVLKALRSNAQHTERFMGVLDACAAAGDTFSDVKSTSQVATAQRKLRLYCAAFWEQLERRGLSGLPARPLATVVYCRARLFGDEVAPAPTDALWGIMARAIEHEAQHMDAQGLANVFLACAYVGEAPAAGARKALFGALRSKQSDIVPQQAANIVWAAGRLHMRLDRTEKHLLLQQLQKHSRPLSAQQVSNAWVGLAHLGLQPGVQLAAELQDAVADVAGAMNGQDVANTLWAFAKLKLQTSDHAVEVLLQRCLTVSSGMSAQEVSNALYAIAKVQLDVDSKLQTALLHRAKQVVPDMPPQCVANSLWALAEADITPGHEFSAALLAQAERISKRFEPVDVVQVLNGAARLGLQPSGSQRRAITTAHKQLVRRMNAMEERIAQRALQQLGWDK